MNKKINIQGYLFKLGFILFICIPQGHAFGFSLIDYKQFPHQVNTELVSSQKPVPKRNILDYFLYKKLLSDQFKLSDDLLLQNIHHKEFLLFYNSELSIRFDHIHKLFCYKIAPTLHEIINPKFNHLYKIETLTYSS